MRWRLKKSPCNFFLKEKFRALRTELKRLLLESRDIFFVSLEVDFKKNTKRSWSVLKQKLKSRGLPSEISMATSRQETGAQYPALPRTTADNPDAIAALFNSYFASAFTSDHDIDTESYLPPDPHLCHLTFTINNIVTAIKGLDVNKATGPDNIPVRLLKETVDGIAPSLYNLFNKSVRLGKFPTEWKIANAVPVRKKDCKQHAENYRLISLLSVVSKIMERCVFNGIKARVHSFIHKCQHGFTAGRSCVTQLVEVLDPGS